MSIEFEGENFDRSKYTSSNDEESKGLIGFLISTGAVKTTRQAEYVLAFLFVVFIGLSIYFFSQSI